MLGRLMVHLYLCQVETYNFMKCQSLGSRFMTYEDDISTRKCILRIIVQVCRISSTPLEIRSFALGLEISLVRPRSLYSCSDHSSVVMTELEKEIHRYFLPYPAQGAESALLAVTVIQEPKVLALIQHDFRRSQKLQTLCDRHSVGSL
jgi:hypothetical protein